MAAGRNEQEGLLPAFTGKGEEMIPESEADYEMVSPRQMFADASNLIPGAFNMKGSRLMISGKYFTQAVPTEEQEAPLVDAYDEDTGGGASRTMGMNIGIRKAERDGEVVNIGRDFIKFKGPDGTTWKEELYEHFPNAKKSYVHETSLVKVGDQVKAGQAIAKNNFVTDEGDLALGRNLRVAFAAAPGGSSFEDSIAVSESAAKKLTSTHLAKFEVDTSRGDMIGKSKFVSMFPGKYTKEQLAKLDDNGMVRPGIELVSGDPVMLSYRPKLVTSKDAALGNLAKMFRGHYDDNSEEWEKPYAGFVTDAIQTRKGLKANVKYAAPLAVGDKLCMTPDHEVLTRRGWVPISSARKGDRVLSMDLDTGRFVEDEVTDTFSFEVDEDLYVVESDQISMMVTDNHKIPVRESEGSYRLRTAGDLSGRRYNPITVGSLEEIPDWPLEHLATYPPVNADRPEWGSAPRVVQGTDDRWESYKGPVHCLETKSTGNFYIRRKGKCHLSGNSARQGAKGVTGKIIPDDQMPVDENGDPVEIFINPAALIGRVNPAMIFEAQLGKIASRTGVREVLRDAPDGDTLAYVRRRLAEAGIKANETLTDPTTGRRIDDVMTGTQYFMKLEHMASDKISARDEGATDINEQPSKGGSEGAKRLGGLMNTALLGHGATEVLRDAHVYRGVDDPEVWKAITSGRPLPNPPKVPFVYRKYLNTLRAAGIRVNENDRQVSISAMTDRDVDELRPKEVDSFETIDDKTGEPIPGGLFDYSIFGGPEQGGWGVIKLDEPIPNPVMEDSLRAVLGMTGKGLREVMSGQKPYKGAYGAKALLRGLQEIDLPSEEKASLEAIRSTRGSSRNDAIKKLKAIRGLRAADLSAADMLVTKIPVMPPVFRPAIKMGDMTVVSDSNYLYKDLLNARNSYRTNKEILPDSDLGDERLAVYDAVRAIQGVGDPIHAETRDKGVKGFLRGLTGDGSGPKRGFFQQKVLGHPVNTVGRSVIVPDSRLNMDQVGIPEDMAWTSFAPFTMGRMVRAGMKPKEAARQIEDRGGTARNFLLEEMKDRPVMYSRDPALHRFSIMGAEPVLVPGKALRISPLVVSGFNADFNGDSISGSNTVICKIDGRVVTSTFFEVASIVVGDTVKGMIEKAENYTRVYPIIPGRVQVIGYDGRDWGWHDASEISVHLSHGQCYRIETHTRKSIVATEHHSLVHLGDDMELHDVDAERLAPGVFLPSVYNFMGEGGEVLLETPAGVVPLDDEAAWFLGFYAAEGSSGGGAVTICCTEKTEFDRAVDWMRRVMGTCTKPQDTTLHNECIYREYRKEWISWFSEWCGTRFDSKKVPNFMFEASVSARRAYIQGFMDGDGNVIANGDRSITIRAEVCNRALVEQIGGLAASIGIRTYTPPSSTGHMVRIAAQDIPKVVEGWTGRKGEEAQSMLTDRGACGDKRQRHDIIPFPETIRSLIRERLGNGRSLSRAEKAEVKEWRSDLPGGLFRKDKSFDNESLTRGMAEDVVWTYGWWLRESSLFSRWVEIVRNRDIGWERVESVEIAEREDVTFDFAVPEVQTFCVHGNLVVHNSMNVHIPVSPDAIKEIREKMMPSRNLLGISKKKPHYRPSQEFVLGLYNATRANPKAGAPVRFGTRGEAVQAYREGLIAIDTPVEIG